MSQDKELWDMFRETYTVDQNIILSKWASFNLTKDVKRFLFTLSRYKFAAKMMENKEGISILELGCNDGLGTLMFAQLPNVQQVIGIDYDADSIQWAEKNLKNEKLEFIEGDFLSGGCEKIGKENVDAIVSLDVIEHIEPSREEEFLNTVHDNLKKDGFLILGTPNIEMLNYTSELTRKIHINNYSQDRLYKSLSRKFHNVFIFGMNDEVLHTGFYPMSCYIMALCCNPK